MRPLYEGVVAEEEIDHLGHMNVRFYLDKALQATRTLAHGLGLDAAAQEMGGVVGVPHLFTRHFREQLAGARLVVQGGVLGARGDGLRFYHELQNVENGELAASFVHDVQLEDAEARKPMPLPESVAARVAEEVADLPERGRPRTLDLDARPREIPLSLALSRGLAMREPRVVGADECDEDGVHLVSRHQDLVWGGIPFPPREGDGPLMRLADGTPFGWATLESRATLHHLPRVGTRIQSFGAEVEIARKTSVRHHWVFDVDTERLVCTSQIVNLAFDIGARRAIEWPPEIRADLERRFHPDLR
ncbi:MAG: thioesterase family protein [Myxococcota bacterium]